MCVYLCVCMCICVCKYVLGRCEASWGEPERDMTVSTRLSDSVFTETHRLENALKSEDE